MREHLIEVGGVRKTHGYAGELKLHVIDIYGEDLANADFVFIGDNEDVALPFEINSIRGVDWIVSLDGLTSKEESASLRGKILYLRAEDVTQEDNEPTNHQTESFERLIGFAVIDEDLGEIGMIESTEAYPQQTMAKVTGKKDTHLVPLNHNLIKGIDFTKKIVFMTLPEGLLDL